MNEILQAFYRKYNLSSQKFAPIAGVGVRTLKKLENGEDIRPDSYARIIVAMQVIEKYNLKRPECSHGFGWDCFWRSEMFRNELCEYEKRCKELIRKEASA